MSNLKLATPERIQAELSRLNPQDTQANMITTADFRPIDQAMGSVLNAMGAALGQGLLAMESWAGALLHPEPPESIKKFYPVEQRVAWSEPVELRVAAFENEASGEMIWLIHPAKNPDRMKIWGSAPGVERFIFGRSLEREMPAAFGYLSEMADEGFAARMKAESQRAELDATASRGAAGGSGPRV